MDRFQNLPSSTKRIQGCPFCGAEHTEEGLFEEEDGGVMTRVDSCPVCDGTWRHEFVFREWAVVLHPSTLEPAEEPVRDQPGLVLQLFKNR